MVTGTATCTATVAWDEGVAGLVVSAHFNTPTVYVDRAATNVYPYEGIKGINSSFVVANAGGNF